MTTAEPDERPRSLAEKLTFLRELKTPTGEKPPSYEAMAREISETGVDISSAYIYNLTIGKAANPRLQHLTALAAYFNVPPSFLVEEEESARIGHQLELLAALKGAGLPQLMLAAKDLSPASLRAVMVMVEQLRALERLDGQQE